MMKNRLVIILGAVLALSSCGCEKKRVLPEVDPALFQRYSQDNELDSKILNRTVKYTVYFPESYMTEKEKRYPVVYMLHGIGDNNNSWNGNYLHANRKIDEWTAKGLGEMIYVFPEGFSSYYCNRFDGTFSYMDMFVEELVPLIDKSLRTIPDKQHRAITGYSMGGFGACALAEKHPELFIACAPLSMSVRTDWQYKEESQDGWNNQWGKIFGGRNEAGDGRITEYYKQHCPIHYFNAENKAILSTVNWYLICGDDEQNLLYANDELHCVMMQNGYKHEYRVVDGGHSSSVWMPALDEVLPMFDYYMNGGSLWAPVKPSNAKPESIDVDNNGVFVSDKYKENNNGTAVFLAFRGISEEYVIGIMNLLKRPYSSSGYVILPCDVSKKSLGDWISYWNTLYSNDKKQVLGLGDGAHDALAMPSETFNRSYYINPNIQEVPSIAKDQEVYFAGSDEDANYLGMNRLYNACKKNEATFEYRIVNSEEDAWADISNSLTAIKSYINY